MTMEAGTKVELDLAVFDSDGNPLDIYDNVDEAIHAACATVIDVWPDYEVATVGYSCNHPDVGAVEIAKVSRCGMRGSRLARVAFAGTSLGTTVEVPVGGFKAKNRKG